MAAVELGLDERGDVDAVDDEVAHLRVDGDIEQDAPAHDDVPQERRAELGPAEVDVVEAGTVQVGLVVLHHAPT